jgi:hypothetical protein
MNLQMCGIGIRKCRETQVGVEEIFISSSKELLWTGNIMHDLVK